MSGEPLLLLLAPASEAVRCESLAKVLARECADAGKPWRVVVDAVERADAERVAVILPERPPTRRRIQRQLRDVPPGHACLVRLGGPLSGRVAMPVFDLSRWPGLAAESALQQFVNWLRLPVQASPTTDGQWLERARQSPVIPWVPGAVAAACLAWWWWPDSRSAEDPVPVRAERLAPTESPAPSAPTAAELAPLADANLEYDSALLSRGMHTGVVQQRWGEADQLVRRALRQAPGDASVAAAVARYWLVRGDFDAARNLLVEHTSALKARDRTLLRDLQQRERETPTHRLCVLAESAGDAWLRYAEAQVAANTLDRASLLDDLCLARLVHSPKGAPLRKLLGLG